MLISSQTISAEESNKLDEFFRLQADEAMKLTSEPLVRRVAVPSPQGGYVMELRPIVTP
jgi:hypothetical protein